MRSKRGGWPYGHPPNTQFELNTQSPQARGLIAWWSMLGQSRGNTLRDLIRGAAGSLNDAVWANRGVGSCIYLDGTSGMAVPTFGDVDISTSFTMHSVMYLPTKPDSWVILFGRSNAQGAIAGWTACQYCYGTTYAFGIGDGAGGFAFDANIAVLPLNTWLYLTTTYDGTVVKSYINGRYQTGQDIATGVTPWSTANSWETGWGDNVNNRLVGYFSEGRLYNRTLSAAEVWVLYDPATRWELYAPVVRYWALGAVAAAGWAFNPVWDGRGVIGSSIVRGVGR